MGFAWCLHKKQAIISLVWGFRRRALRLSSSGWIGLHNQGSLCWLLWCTSLHPPKMQTRLLHVHCCLWRRFWRCSHHCVIGWWLSSNKCTREICLIYILSLGIHTYSNGWWKNKSFHALDQTLICSCHLLCKFLHRV